MRTVLLLSSLLFAACTVGEIGTANQNNGNTDAGTSPVGNACIDRVTPAGTAHEHGGAGGPTHAGENCITGGCHQNDDLGIGATGFQFAGTVYKSDGTTPNPGVSIRVIGNGGTAMTMVSDAAGTFSLGAGSLPMAFPATTHATACPTVATMSGQLIGGAGGTGGTSDGACSKSGCHVAAGGAGVIKLADQ